MNEKNDDSGGKYDPHADTASLLESLFKDNENSTIKVVKRKMRPKPGVKKRVISKQKKDEGKEIPKIRARKQGRPSTSEKSAGASKSKIHSRKTSPPGSDALKNSKTKQSPKKLRPRSAAGARPTPKVRRDGGKSVAKPGIPKKEPPSSRTIAGPGEERTEALDPSVLNSMISMASGIKGSREDLHHKPPTEERPKFKNGRSAGKRASEADDLRVTPPADTEGVHGADEEITETLEKSTINSLISALEESGKDIHSKVSAEESSVPKEEETGIQALLDNGALKEDAPADIERIAEGEDEITEVLEKSTINSLISALERNGEKGQEKASAEENPVSEEGEADVEIFFDGDDSEEEAPATIEGMAGGEDEITEVLEKSILNSLISALEESGEEGQDQASTEEGSVSKEEDAGFGTVIDGEDLKEEAPADIEGIAEATKPSLPSQEKPAAPGSITIEDPLLDTSGREAYPESALGETSISKERKEAVEETSQSVDPKEKRSSDSDTAELTEKKTPSQEKPAVSTSIPFETSGAKADTLEVHHILEDEEKPILEDKEEGVEKTFEGVDLEIGPLPDTSEPVKEKSPFQEEPVSGSASSGDSMVQTSEEEPHHEATAEEEPVPKVGEDDIEKAAEPEESKEEEPPDLEERVVLAEEELRLAERSGRRSMVIRIGLPLVFFGILAVVLSIQYAPLDFFRREQVQEPGNEKIVEVSSTKKQKNTPETSKETASAAGQGVQPSIPAPVTKEIVRAPVPRKQDTMPETQKETTAAPSSEVQPSTSETPTILAMKANVVGSSPEEQDTTPKTSKEVVAAAEQEVGPGPLEPATSPPSGDTAAKAEADQKETLRSYPYSVYLSSYGSLEGAENAVSKYSEDGLSSLYWEEVDLGDKGTWYRVFSGYFETKGKAEEYVKERQLVGARVQETKQSVSKSLTSTKDVAPKQEVPEEQRLLPKATAGSSYPYSVYIGSYKALDRAQRAISDYQAKGPSYWVKTDLGDKGIWYRVYIGCFQTRDEAETFIRNHEIVDGESRHTTYANLIGTYSSDGDLDEIRLSLLNLGFSPYVIEESSGLYRLFTGAFFQKARAEEEHRDLAAKGIQSQLVER